MRRITTLVALGCLASVGLVGRVALAIDNLRTGDVFPSFSLPRADGSGEYARDQLDGKLAIVVFWRPRQDLSLEALRDLQQITEDIGGDRIEVVAVDTSRATAEEIRASLEDESVSFPLLLDPHRALYGKVGVIASPTSLVLDARGTLRFVLASHPRAYRQVMTARVRFLLGDITEEDMKKRVEPAILRIDHDLAAAWRMYHLGRKLQAEGKSTEAVSAFEEAVSRYPSLSEARCALGFLKLSEGDLDTAAKHFQTDLAYSPTSPLARLGKAAVLARSGRPEEAEPILLGLLGQRSVAARVRYELGRIYHARGENGSALTYFEDALAVIFPEPRGPTSGSRAEQAISIDRPPAATSPPARAASSRVASFAPGTGTLPAGSSSVTPVVPPEDAKYLGVKSCKKCHFQQWKSWQETRMANAFELLEPGVRSDVKEERNLDPRKDYTADPSCLRCHTTGFGHAGSYPASAAGGSAQPPAVKELASVGCEACHGPGSEYSKIHKTIQDTRRKYTRKELFDAGQYEVSAGVCAACHDGKGPCMDPGNIFDFEKRKDEGTHRHYQLQFRSD